MYTFFIGYLNPPRDHRPMAVERLGCSRRTRRRRRVVVPVLPVTSRPRLIAAPVRPPMPPSTTAVRIAVVESATTRHRLWHCGSTLETIFLPLLRSSVILVMACGLQVHAVVGHSRVVGRERQRRNLDRAEREGLHGRQFAAVRQCHTGALGDIHRAAQADGLLEADEVGVHGERGALQHVERPEEVELLTVYGPK